MKISLLQPEIRRGDIAYNRDQIQTLIHQSEGDLLVLPEYALTGSLVLDPGADPRSWAEGCAIARAQLALPPGRHLLLNLLVMDQDGLHNCCELLPGGARYCKLHPDETERLAGILPGVESTTFSLHGKHFKVLICYDLPNTNLLDTSGLDFLLFIYHFSAANLSRVMGELRTLSEKMGLPVLASSLVSDQNNGHSSYIARGVTVSLADQSGILEVDLE